MKPNFEYGQFIVKKMRPIKECSSFLGLDFITYTEKDTPEYGVFCIEPYMNGDWKAPIEYKVRLVPVGKSSIKFMDVDFYTLDLRDTPDEMVFNDLNLAEAFINDHCNK